MTDGPIRAVALLDDELRRAMYTFVRRARRPVTRDDVATTVGVSRKLAAFHLDKLADAGLLSVSHAAAGTRRTVGRAPKVYEPGDREIQVSIPQRRHDMLAGILLDAVLSDGDGESAREATLRVARERGTQLGTAERSRTRPGRLGAERALTVACGVLERYGYEPARVRPTCVRLHNCPFHPLAAREPAAVCGLNHAFIGGLLAGLRARNLEAALEPRSGECCVELRTASPPVRDDS
ncbi:MAG: helix-turn-helix transcriptional regulator [Actinomycetota bacterium]